jgi:hypothetical protein
MRDSNGWEARLIYLNMSSDPQHKTQVQAEGLDVCASFTGDPENHQVATLIELDELAVVDRPHSPHALLTRYERGRLKYRPCQALQGPCYQGQATLQL